ncbi:MAG TPA: GNAT family N-acetyltransferase [Prosthecobacter sp.]|nr:GNAT family N-acetyltransferase [Prosthecobacter sp.]
MSFEEDDELNLEELSPLMQALVPKVAACRIREFQSDDLEACVEIHRSNQAEFVEPDALESFVAFLEGGTSYILVIEHDGDVIACGGLELVGDPDSATLRHSMVHREYQRRGFGSALLAAQLSLMEHEDRPMDLWARAGSETAGFYERLGFETQKGADEASTLLWRSIDPGDIEDARAALIKRNIQLVLNAEEDDEGEEEGTWGEEQEE